MTPKPSPTRQPAREDADAWFTPGRFALIFALLLVVCFPGVIFGFETFFFRDFGIFTYSDAFYQRECFWRGEIPLWNPLNDCGVPFLAQWNTVALYPPSLFYLLLPLSWSLPVFELGHLLFAALGMYFLAHRWTGNRLAASVAGTVFGFNGLMWYMLMWTSNLAATAWMPWVVLAAETAWREGGPRKLVLAALAAAMQMLTGSPESIALTWLLVVSLWLSELLVADSSRRRAAWQFLFAPLLVAGLAAAQLLPFIDLLQHSQRDASFGGTYWSMPRGGWANFLVPLFHCYRTMQGVYTPFNEYWSSSYYLGAGTVALALLALWAVRDRRTRILAGLTCACLVLALGDNGFVFLILRRVLPFIGVMRYPVKFVILPAMLVPLLAAVALARLRALPEGQWAAARNKLRWLALTLPAAMALIVWWAWFRPAPQEKPLETLENAVIRVAFLLAVLGCLVMLRRAREFRAQLLLRLGLLLLLWFDVFTHMPRLQPGVQTVAYEPGVMRKFFKENFKLRDDQLTFGESRAMHNRASLMRMMFSWIDDPLLDVQGHRIAMFPNYNLLDGVPVFDGFYSLELREYCRLNDQVYSYPANDLTGLQNFLGVSHISHPTNAVSWITRDTYLPLITAGQEPVFVEDETALQAVTSPAFDPARAVYLPPEARSVVTARRAEAKVLSHQFAAEHLEAEVEGTAPALLVVAQTYYHPWRAFVDGQPVRLWRANYSFQALEVPAGRHQVRLVYDDVVFKAGALISLGTLALCLVGWLFGRKSSVAK